MTVINNDILIVISSIAIIVKDYPRGPHSSEVHKQGRMTTGRSVETLELLTEEPVPCRHMPLLM